MNPTSVLVKYTYYGDANLDGTVNALDFNALANGYGQTPGSNVWSQGDFNYDGTVNSSDFALLAANYGQVMPSDAAALLGQIVPEPAPLLALFLPPAGSATDTMTMATNVGYGRDVHSIFLVLTPRQC